MRGFTLLTLVYVQCCWQLIRAGHSVEFCRITRTCGALRRARPVAGDDVNQYAVGASNWIIRNFIQNIWYFVSGSF